VKKQGCPRRRKHRVRQSYLLVANRVKRSLFFELGVFVRVAISRNFCVGVFNQWKLTWCSTEASDRRQSVVVSSRVHLEVVVLCIAHGAIDLRHINAQFVSLCRRHLVEVVVTCEHTQLEFTLQVLNLRCGQNHLLTGIVVVNAVDFFSFLAWCDYSRWVEFSTWLTR